MDSVLPDRDSALQTEFDACILEIDRIREKVRKDWAKIDAADARIARKLEELQSAIRDLRAC